VEARADNDIVTMRNSLDLTQPYFSWSRERWEVFLSWVTTGFVNADLFGKSTGLIFTAEEWCAFREGVIKGEFEYHVLARKSIDKD
jgi:hypothetical protein